MRLLTATALIALSSCVSSSIAFAADAPPKMTLVRGTIEKLDAKSITLKTESGSEVSADVSLSSRFAAVEKRSLAQIKPTDFVGITAVPGKDGHLTAQEVHVIPLAGIGEGQYPWDHHPSTAKAGGTGSMTNGTVMASGGSNMMMAAPKPATPGSMTNGTVMTGAAGGELNITYHGAAMVNGKCAGLAVPGKPGCTGTSVVDVSGDTPIVAIVPYRHELVKPGAYAVAAIMTDASGKMSLSSATVEKGGVRPEF